MKRKGIQKSCVNQNDVCIWLNYITCAHRREITIDKFINNNFYVYNKHLYTLQYLYKWETAFRVKLQHASMCCWMCWSWCMYEQKQQHFTSIRNSWSGGGGVDVVVDDDDAIAIVFLRQVCGFYATLHWFCLYIFLYLCFICFVCFIFSWQSSHEQVANVCVWCTRAFVI